MKPEEMAAKLGVSLDELFEQAHAKYGIMQATGGCASDLSWYRKWKSAPIYVQRFCREAERRANAPVIDA